MTGASRQASRAGSLALVGGVLALDFCNTESGRGTERHLEHLQTASDLLAWAHHATIVDETNHARLRIVCADQTFAQGLLQHTLDLRDAIRDGTTALAHGEQPAQTTIDLIAATHAACLVKGRLVTHQGAFGWTWSLDDAPAEVILGPIAASAIAVITTAHRARLKRCEGRNCGWLFLDTTKGNNRVWCDMDRCGNRAKQSRRRGRDRSDV